MMNRRRWKMGHIVPTLACIGATWPDLSVPPPATGHGDNDAAVIVGIEDYLVVPDVEGARRNADDWYRFLTTTKHIPPNRVKLLRDNEGTDVQIRDALHHAISQTERGGTMWFIYIGHGAPSKDGANGLLVGVDAQQNATGIYSRSILRSEVQTILGDGKQTSTVVLLDACFSGTTSSGTPLVPDLQPVVPTYSMPSPVLVLSAAQSDQFAGPLPGTARPAFSYLILGALRGWGDKDSDGDVTALEAVEYANEALLATVNGRPQVAELTGPNQDTVLAEGFEKGPDLAGIALGSTESVIMSDSSHKGRHNKKDQEKCSPKPSHQKGPANTR
ncbi:MAG: caspase family protein [Proteobacteria bacterium]|nr:caspase family protein [Pseudomonadota bacterium]